MIAFTENAEKGQNDIQLKMYVSRYLARFHGDEMTSEQISEIASRFAGSCYELIVRQTKEAFVYAYENQDVCSESSSYTSCMAKSTSHFGTPVHPAAVYYTGDTPKSLSIAYIPDPHNPARVLARSLVHTNDMHFVRVYGTDERMRSILIEKLEAAGFTRTCDFEGIRLAAISNGYVDSYVMPYIDGDINCVTLHEHDSIRGNYFTIDSNGDHQATETSGHITVGNRYRCDACGDGIDDGDECIVQEYTYCPHCRHEYTFFCEYYEETYPSDTDHHDVVVMRPNFRGDMRETTQVWSQRAINRYAFYCGRTDTYYANEDFNHIDVIVPDRYTSSGVSSERWCAERTSDGYFICPDCGEAFHIDLCVIDGRTGEMLCKDCHAERNEQPETVLKPVAVTNNDPCQHVFDWQLAQWEAAEAAQWVAE
jgi:hypothetical protein